MGRLGKLKEVRSNSVPLGRRALEALGERLKEIRNQRGISQVELAEILKVGQTALSHAETRSDMKLSTLLEYVSALGGHLQVTAFFDDLGRKDLLGERPEDFQKMHDAQQLELPGFPAPAPPSSGRDVVLSVKPRYADRILDGTKTVELRRRFSKAVPAGALAWIYSTTPTKALTGAATISEVQKLPLRDIWKRHHEAAALNRSDFEAYFSGLDSGYAILLSSPKVLPNPISLSELRDLCDFEPPQSYQYASSQLSRLFDGGWPEALN